MTARAGSKVFLAATTGSRGRGAQPCAGSAGFGLTGVELLLSESALPTITNDGGSLVSNTIHSGTERVYFTATDADSGVAKVEVLIDDRVVATRDYTTTASCAFETWQACEPNQADALDVNTTTIANGQHSLALRATDAAGNRKATTTPMTIQVANPTPGVPPAGNGVGPAGGNGVDGAPGAPGASGSAVASGSVVHANGLNASASAALQAQFVTNKGRRIKARYGRVVPISGRLVGPNGRAVAGAKLDVLRQIQTPGSPMTKVGEVVTDSRGAFTYEAPIGRPPHPLRLPRVPRERRLRPDERRRPPGHRRGQARSQQAVGPQPQRHHLPRHPARRPGRVAQGDRDAGQGLAASGRPSTPPEPAAAAASPSATGSPAPRPRGPTRSAPGSAPRPGSRT